ncbi:hypothetical protein [Streptomyces sp. SID2888]|uniref:hypothetical protein n=1 Tax=Streptomyces sp. SID2888 TaxID=2690256 RepID=UPI00136C164C|nr:hypothetical protein [Streptomyces sp. SID2888]MYV48585.1 hypothetical protein [Streptomyces sp. SID2888]
MRLCDRCGKRITPDEDYRPYDIPAGSGAGITVFLHVRPCRRAQLQTAPSGRQPARRYR